MIDGEKVPEEIKPAKWTVTVGGNEWGTVKYGIVEYLRRHPRMRAATAITGVLWVGGWLASTAGFRWHIVWFPAISAVFVTPTLLWLAVVSGPEFKLTFPEAKTPDSPVAPTTAAKAVLDPEGYGIEALDKSYVWTEGYARSSFRWSMFSLFAAIFVGAANLWLITIGALFVIRFYTATFIWVFAATLLLLCIIFIVRSMFLFRRAASIHDRLLQLQKTITAIKYLERTQGGSASIDPSLVISSLLASPEQPDVLKG
ncbi:MAG: hypothetical protein ABR910_09565 [Acidobacteriaceae bacterium]|jgi:MFS family permease